MAETAADSRAGARSASSGKIFINYRRADAPDSAGRLDDVLEAEFSREVVFKDVVRLRLAMISRRSSAARWRLATSSSRSSGQTG